MTQGQRDIKRKLASLQDANESGNVALTARHFGISRQCYHNWKRVAAHGHAALAASISPRHGFSSASWRSISATQSWSGAVAVKSRCTRSGALRRSRTRVASCAPRSDASPVRH